MEYHDNRLCISMRELVDGGVMTVSNYKQLSARGRIDVVRRGGGSANNYALIAVSSLPDVYQEKLKTLYPDPSMEVLLAWLDANYEVDQAAVAYFNDWRNQCGHDHATDAHVKEYVTNASVLNACIKLYNNAKAIQKTMGQKYDWSMMSQAVEGYRMKTGHTLPASMLRFRKKVNEYQREGYQCLISRKFGNQASRKVDYRTMRLIWSIAVQPNQPFNTSVWEMYNSFVCGELDVYDPETGELFDPSEWADKNGDPKSLSESTITNYLNRPDARLFIAKQQNSYTTFMHEQMPHVHRHAPEFSFSKISFDDRDLPRKLKDTKARPKAYYAYKPVRGGLRLQPQQERGPGGRLLPLHVPADRKQRVGLPCTGRGGEPPDDPMERQFPEGRRFVPIRAFLRPDELAGEIRRADERSQETQRGAPQPPRHRTFLR